MQVAPRFRPCNEDGGSVSGAFKSAPQRPRAASADGDGAFAKKVHGLVGPLTSTTVEPDSDDRAAVEVPVDHRAPKISRIALDSPRASPRRSGSALEAASGPQRAEDARARSGVTGDAQRRCVPLCDDARRCAPSRARTTSVRGPGQNASASDRAPRATGAANRSSHVGPRDEQLHRLARPDAASPRRCVATSVGVGLRDECRRRSRSGRRRHRRAATIRSGFVDRRQKRRHTTRGCPVEVVAHGSPPGSTPACHRVADLEGHGSAAGSATRARRRRSARDTSSPIRSRRTARPAARPGRRPADPSPSGTYGGFDDDEVDASTELVRHRVEQVAPCEPHVEIQGGVALRRAKRERLLADVGCDDLGVVGRSTGDRERDRAGARSDVDDDGPRDRPRSARARRRRTSPSPGAGRALPARMRARVRRSRGRLRCRRAAHPLHVVRASCVELRRCRRRRARQPSRPEIAPTQAEGVRGEPLGVDSAAIDHGQPAAERSRCACRSHASAVRQGQTPQPWPSTSSACEQRCDRGRRCRRRALAGCRAS